MKSTTCKGQKGQFLEEYLSQAAALHAAKEIKTEFGHDLVPNIPYREYYIDLRLKMALKFPKGNNYLLFRANMPNITVREYLTCYEIYS